MITQDETNHADVELLIPTCPWCDKPLEGQGINGLHHDCASKLSEECRRRRSPWHLLQEDRQTLDRNVGAGEPLAYRREQMAKLTNEETVCQAAIKALAALDKSRVSYAGVDFPVEDSHDWVTARNALWHLLYRHNYVFKGGKPVKFGGDENE